MFRSSIHAVIVSICTSALLAAHAQSTAPNPAVLSCAFEDGHHTKFHERTCPLEGETYKSLGMGASMSTFGSHLDLTRASYLDLPFPIGVCPSNGFVDFADEYTDQQMIALKTVIETDQYKSLLGKHTSWYLFAYVVEQTKFDGYDTWWLYNNAAAEAHNCGYEQEKQYLETTRAQIDAALTNISPDSEDQPYWAMQLIAANASRRLAEFDDTASRLGALAGVPDDWKEAFDTLETANDRQLTRQVRIGETEFDE
ncbi:MAG: hypothetical protein AAFX02_06080 [Pseudomonadota bacterium]